MKNVHAEKEEWISVSERILHEQPERLQELLLDISRRHPEMSFYAADLARLRMAGREREKELEELWQARSEDRIDAIVNNHFPAGDPLCRALSFLAGLVRTRLTGRERGQAGRDLCHRGEDSPRLSRSCPEGTTAFGLRAPGGTSPSPPSGRPH